MLKKELKYTNFDDEEVTETHYFNISKPELVELEFDQKEGLDAFLKRIIKIEDRKELYAMFKKIILLAYGERSDDGRRFMKNEELRVGFEHSGAYEALFMELISSEEAMARFITAILPKDMVGQDQDKPAAPLTSVPTAPQTDAPST